MGERINIYFENGTDYTVGLYSHWGGYDIDKHLSEAIFKAHNRWDDPDYGTRIIISHFLRDSIDEETGYGIFAVKLRDYKTQEHGYRVVDFLNRRVRSDTRAFLSFQDYITNYRR